MEGADALGLIAEVGIAIAGFAGVVATLRAPGGRIGIYGAVRIGVLLGTSSAAVLLALLPFALHFAGLARATVWAVSSSLAAAFALGAMFLPWGFAYAKRAMPAPEHRAPGWVVFASFQVVTTLGIAALHFCNAAFVRELWPFYLGLLAQTALAVFHFAYLLFTPARAEVQA